MIVVDSNVLAARSLTSAQHSLALQIEKKDPFWIVPNLWRYEFQNILATYVKAREITVESAFENWRRMVHLLFNNESDPSPEKVIDLASRYRISAYDANFIALALEMDIPCVTEDGKLQAKFPGVAISMRGFLGQGDEPHAVRERKAAYTARKKRSR